MSGEPERRTASANGAEPEAEGAVPCREGEIETSVPDRFEEQVRLHGGLIAVKCGDFAITYEELNASANRVAWALLDRLGEGEEPVPLLFGNDAAMVAAMLGALKAGKAYVPLDPDIPSERTGYVVGDSEARLIVTDGQNIALARQTAPDGARVVNVDDLAASAADGDPRLPIAPDRLALLMYTSGSTGRPKGVMLTHRTALRDGRVPAYHYGLQPGDRCAQTGSLALGGFLRRLYSSLLNGATLCLYDAKKRGLAGLVDWLRAEEITMLGARAVFEGLTANLKEGEILPSVRHISFGGDVVYRHHVLQARRFTRPECVIQSNLGSTEAGSIARYTVPRDMELRELVMPVGRPLPGMEVLILDEERHPVRDGQVGEIYVRSRYLSRGYWRRPDLTGRAFFPDPDGGDRRIYRTGDLGMFGLDGLLRHRGRADFQLKIRGYTIQAGDVEAAMRELEDVTEAAVTGQERTGGMKRLVAHLTSPPGMRPTVTSLRQALARALPDYMVPAAFVFLDEMPKTPLGKIDRRALPPPGTARPELANPFVAPRTPIEEALAAAWRDVLELDEVGVNDSFLDLGGNSLLAARVINRIRNEFVAEVEVSSMFAKPTVAAQAVAVLQAQASSLGPEAVSELLKRTRQ